MPEGSLPALPTRRFLRSRRNHVAALQSWGAQASARLAEVEAERDELRDRLRDARDELRYWHDRQVLVDDAVRVAETARQRADEVEAQARERAERLETRAREHAVKLVEHVCVEADSILQHAREEAASFRSRTERSLAASNARVEQLSHVQLEVTHSIRSAMHRFEEGLVELESTGPSRRFLPNVETIAEADEVVEQDQAPAPAATPPYDAPNLLEVARHAAAASVAHTSSTPL